MDCQCTTVTFGWLCSPQHGRQGGSDYVDALCALLLLQALPSSALWGIGWLLLQVFGLRKAGQVCLAAVLNATQQTSPTWCRWELN